MTFFDGFAVDGKPILTPDAGVELKQQDLDAADAGRDESGVMHRIVVRSRVKSWEFRYSALTSREYAYLQSLLTSGFIFTYPTPDGASQTCAAYCSGESITYFDARLGLYKNYRFTVTEC